MRVVTDGRALTGLGHLGGIGTFSRNLYAALAARPGVEVAALLTDPKAAPPGVEPLRMQRFFDDRRPAIYEHEARLPVDLLLRRCDVVYSPEVAGVAWTRQPYVQTLHDVIPLVIDTPDLARQRKWWRRWARRYRRADAVVAISRYSADEGIRLLGLDPGRVHVVPNGVNPGFSPDGAVGAGDLDDGRPYLLAVGEYAPRKAWADACEVVGRLGELGFEHRLVLAGRIRPHFTDEVDQAIAPYADRVEVRGFVDDLPALYRGATAYVCTSRYEGFGLPLVEAMASGVPVVTYGNSSLPEVVGDAGIVVPDGDVEAMTAAVRSLLESPARRDELRAAGLERAKRFTWEAAAADYEEILRDAAAGA